ncbi:helix-turn-helix transcriptional regulator [Streptomyces tauricus]|uniref:helix-turn-helix transcriptional regulator n=1 Tax=Streptomyces tauricus TaxID=68274 RepID=UPI0033AD296F
MRDGTALVILERESELTGAAADLRRAAAGDGALLVVEGSLGTGRSSFLEALSHRARADRFRVLKAQASMSERAFALGVANQLVESGCCDAAATTAAPGRGQVTGPPGRARLHGGPSDTPSALSRLLDTASGDSPLLVLVDDLHWADTESLLVLSRSVDGRHSRRILFVVSLPSGVVPARSSRLGELVAAADRTVRLGPLGATAVRRLVEDTFGGEADKEFVDSVEVRSGGNPLLLRSLLDEAYSRGLSPKAEHSDLARTLRPDSLCQYLAGFLRSQPDHVRRVVHALCVLGDSADASLAAQLAGLDASRYSEAVAVLDRSGLSPSDGRWDGTVLWESLADGIPAQELTVLRNRAAVLLHRAGHPVEDAAEQLMSVPTPQAPQAVLILRAAADSAMERGAPRDAARYLRQALLDSSCAGPVRAQVLADLAAAERGFATVAALRHVIEALPLFDSDRERAAAVVQLGPLLFHPSESDIATLTDKVATGLRGPGAEDAVAAELALRLEARRYALGAQDPSLFPAALHRLEELGPRPPVRTAGQRELLASLIHIAFVTNSTSAERAAELGTLLLAHEAPDPRHAHTSLPLAVNALAAAERTEEAARWLLAVGQGARGEGADVEAAVVRAERAMVALAHGDAAEAKQTILRTDIMAGPQASGLPTVCTAILAIVALHGDEPELAEEFLTRNLLSHEDQYLAALLHMARGLLAARLAHDRIALHHFRTAGERLERIGWSNPTLLPWSSCAALMHHRLGERDQALAAGRLEVERARRWGSPAVEGRALVALGRVTPGRRGAALLAEAVSVLEGSTNRHELCRALYAFGSRKGIDGRRAEEILDKAHALSVECGADRVAQKVRARLSRGPAVTTTVPELTPSELRVARLAAAGLRNADIARQLNVSTRMVEKYLTNSYRKLDIPGRHALPSDIGKA